MKKLIIYFGSVVFSALMVYNISADNLFAKNTDVSLESIRIMAAAANYEDPPVEDEFKWIKRKHFKNCSGSVTYFDFTIYSWACENCAWDCIAEKVEKTNPTTSNCNDDWTCQQVYVDKYKKPWVMG